MNVPAPDAAALWRWLPVGYLMTVALEAPVLLAGLHRHTARERMTAALWLTAVTYPVVAIALPLLLWPHAPYSTYVVVAEVFAIAVECALFRVVWRGTPRDQAVVALANVVSAVGGWWLLAR